MTTTLPFLGKWTLVQGNSYVQIDPTAGILKVAAQPSDGSEKFNAYGTTSAFILQANNGQYIVSSGSNYVASKERTDSLNQFSLVSGDAGAYRILDLGVGGQGTTQYYWNNASGALSPVGTGSPPPTTDFTQTVVTPGLTDILQKGFSSEQPDLTWVYLANTDFSQAQSILDFTQSNLSYADFSGATFSQGTGFDNSTASHVNFTNAILPQCSFGTAHLENANFTQAHLTGIDLNGSWLNNAVLTGAKLTGGINLAGTQFAGAKMQGADLSNVQNIYDTDFTGADLTGAVFTGSSVTGTMTIEGANLTDALLNNIDYWQIVDGTNHYVIIQGYGQTWGNTCLGVAQSLIPAVKPTFFLPYSLKVLLPLDSASQTVDSEIVREFLAQGKIALSSAATVTFKQYVTIYPQQLKVNQKTNFTGANLKYLDFTGYDLNHILFTHADLTGCKLDKTKLIGTEMSYGNFTNVTFTGGVPLFGANLSNATLTNADLTGAQMGALSKLFAVPQSNTAEFSKFQDGLTKNNAVEIAAVFQNNGIALQGPLTISASQFTPDRAWTVQDAQNTYNVRLDTAAGSSSLGVYQTQPAAVLANAFMLGTILTSANLYNVRASGIHLYGGAKLDGYAILEGAQFNNSNLSGINLQQGSLYGVNFDYCTLNGAQFDGAQLTLSTAGGVASFNGANLQGASFKDAKLANAVFTDAAVAVNQPSSNDLAGVWLFSIPPQNTPNITAQLTAAATGSNNFTLPLMAANVLKPGPVAPGIVKAFAAQGITLSSAALVSVLDETAFWQIEDGTNVYSLYEGCDASAYQPALGVTKGTNPLATPLFYVPYSLANELQPGVVTSDVIAAFNFKGTITLNPTATVTVAQQPSDWTLVDTGASYTLGLGLSMDCTLQISVRPSMPAVLSVFSDNSIPLSNRATVSCPKTNVWSINNDGDNPFNAVRNYIKFNVLLNDQGGLDVYGSQLRIVRLSAQGQQEYYNISCTVTELENDLDESTICPNSMLVSSNKTDQLPFNVWMRAKIPPRAPFCVPSADGTYYCPQ